MCTDIDQRTAALLGLICEYAPGRNATTTEVCSLCVVNIAEETFVNNLLSNLILGEVTVLVADCQHLAGSVSCVEHLLCIFRSSSHRLLAENVLASFESSNGDLAVSDVRSQNVNCVDCRVSQKLLVVCVDLSVRCAVFLSSLLSSLDDEVAECAEIYAFHALHAREVLLVSDTTATDETNFQICHGISPPNLDGTIAHTDLFYMVILTYL